jgi:HD-GYP domain-containing protein (c-di-GMP phosphodiesterase class II)
MPQSFFSISLKSLRVNSAPSFDLYIRHASSGKHVLYREKNTAFTEKTLLHLLDSRIEELHVPREQRDDYFEYSGRLVADVVSDERVSTKEKSSLVYSTTATIMEDLFVTPRSSTRIRQAKDTIHTTVDFIVQDDEAARSLIFLTCHDYYTYTHSVNVTIFATTLAQRIFGSSSSEHDLKVISEGFLMHDIGKSTIPATIINKPGKLDDEEWRIMRNHPENGDRILAETHQSSEAIRHVVLEHHERLGGGGYPKNLSGDQIHPYAKLCCIADVFDALTTIRSYRDPLTTFEALKLMRGKMTDHFDLDYFNEFVQVFEER